jgi:uncharacterized glyoxalase superfamily protein PhnB
LGNVSVIAGADLLSCSSVSEKFRDVADVPKINSCNFAAFRAQAERCFHHAQLAVDQETKLRWTSLGETWLVFADKLGMRWSLPVSEPVKETLSPTYH